MPDPIAYLLTWTTYGTWLPGDERGWADYGRGMRLPDPIIEREAAGRMTEDACILDEEQRQLVEATVADHCSVRGWTLHAVNCRSNHVHVVVEAKGDRVHPDDMRDQFKAWCTRKLKNLERERRVRADGGCAQVPAEVEHDVVPGEWIREKWWTERGSGLYINDQEGLEAVIFYVREVQDRVGELEREHVPREV